MKRNGYKVIALIGIVLAVGAIGLGVFSLVRYITAYLPSELSTNELNDKYQVIQLELDSPVSTFKVKGIWQGTIEIDTTLSKPKLELTLPKQADANKAWQQNGNALEILSPDGQINSGFLLKTPSVEQIDMDIVGDLRFSSLPEQGLSLNLKGIGRVSAQEGSVQSLKLTGSWIGDIEFSNSNIPELELMLELTGKLACGKIGTVRGRLIGIGDFSYASIAEQSSFTSQEFLGSNRMED
jgi:hypothetical protein